MTSVGEPPAAGADIGGGIFDPVRRPLTIGLVLVITLVAFEALAAAAAFPVVLDDLGGVALYGWTFSGFMLASLVGITVAGRASDRHGPRRPFLGGAALFAAGLVVVGAAPAMWVVVAGRVVQGMGAGAVPAVVYVVIGRSYDPALRPRMFAVLSSAWVLPALIGPAVSGTVAEHLSWRLVFVGILPLLAIATVLTAPGLRRLDPVPGDTEPGEGGRITLAVCLAVGAGLVIAGLGHRSLLALPLLGAGAALGFPALRRLVPEGTLRARPGLPAAIALRGLLTFSFFGVDAFLPLMLTSVRRTSPAVAGVALTAAALSWSAGAWVQERWSDRWAIRRFSCGGAALISAGITVSATALSGRVPVGVAWVGWGVAGLGMGMAYPMSSLVVLAHAGEEAVGGTIAALQLSDMLGVALGTGLGGAVIATGEAAGWTRASSIAMVDALMLAVLGLALVAAARLPDRLFGRHRA